MTGGGGDVPLPPAANGGEFLLSLLQKPHPQHPPSQLQPNLQQPPHPSSILPQQQQSPTLDPAVAAIGPTIPFLPPWPSNGQDPQSHLPPWPHSLSPSYPSNIFGLPPNPFSSPQIPGSQFPGNHIPIGNIEVNFGDDLRRLGFPTDAGGNRNYAFAQQQQRDKLKFGSFPSDIFGHEISSNGDDLLNFKFNAAKEQEGFWNRSYNGLDKNQPVDAKASSISNSNMNAVRPGNNHDQERRGSGRGNLSHGGNNRSMQFPETRLPPPVLANKHKGTGYWGNRRRGLEINQDRNVVNSGAFRDRIESVIHDKGRVRTLSAERSVNRGNKSREGGLPEQLDHSGPPTGSNLHSVSASDIEESMSNIHSNVIEDGVGDGHRRGDRSKEENMCESGELDDLGEHFVESLLLEDGSENKNNSRQHRSSRDKDVRSDPRGQRLLSQRARMLKRQMICRNDIDNLNARFLAIYESLIPPEEEKTNQKQLLTLLEKLVSKEWPKAQLFLYGSCANSFGVCKSDIDVCLAIEEANMKKSEILLKLADILQSDNLQNVQALTRARVPIVKLMDPITGISCDICINNLLAVENTKLLWDYAQIDVRLRQLAFIIKHWAKSRGVNETYQGTLSSYAYVLMCIHFLQQRRPAILPCLQEMETTYHVEVENVECSYFDEAEKLRDFGHNNKENIAQLVWGFFNYWAYRHDYANAVISVRTGSILSKRDKDWTRRIGNDRHLICIEDPFETSHDLGRVVDKFSIKVLREEFERAAEIIQFDPNPCVKLFEPFVAS